MNGEETIEQSDCSCHRLLPRVGVRHYGIVGSGTRCDGACGQWHSDGHLLGSGSADCRVRASWRSAGRLWRRVDEASGSRPNREARSRLFSAQYRANATLLPWLADLPDTVGQITGARPADCSGSAPWSKSADTVCAFFTPHATLDSHSTSDVVLRLVPVTLVALRPAHGRQGRLRPLVLRRRG